MSAHRAWRAKTTAAPGAYVAYSEMQIRSSVGGSDLTNIVGSAIQDSNYPGLPASQAFDDNINTLWACNGTGTSSWLGWDFGSTVGNWVDAKEFVLTTRNDGSWGQYASGINFEWSDDWNGTIGTWTSVLSVSPAWSGAGQSLTFAPIPGLAIPETTAYVDLVGVGLHIPETTAYVSVVQPGMLVSEETVYVDRMNPGLSVAEETAYISLIKLDRNRRMSLM